MDKKYCYSWNNEDFGGDSFKSREEAIEFANKERKETNEELGREFYDNKVWTGIAITPTLKWDNQCEDIIYSIEDNLLDDCGEYAEYALDITKEQTEQLEGMIDKIVEQWIAGNKLVPSCYTIIDCKMHELKD